MNSTLPQPRAFVLSAYREGLTASANHQRHCDLCADLALEGLPFREVDGRFKGVSEDGCLVVGHVEGTVRALAHHFEQASYLAVSEWDRGAYLVNVQTGYFSSLGKLRNVGIVKPAGDYTAIDGWYYQTDGVTGPDLPGGF